MSGNIIKNAMGVGIPGTGMIGLPIAVALGALIGKSELGLEVLQEVNEEAVEKAKVFLDKDCIEIIHDEEAPSNLFIDTVVSHGTQTARAVISRNHTHFVFLEKTEKEFMKKRVGTMPALKKTKLKKFSST